MTTGAGGVDCRGRNSTPIFVLEAASLLLALTRQDGWAACLEFVHAGVGGLGFMVANLDTAGNIRCYLPGERCQAMHNAHHSPEREVRFQSRSSKIWGFRV